jgi:hypothetical protein
MVFRSSSLSPSLYVGRVICEVLQTLGILFVHHVKDSDRVSCAWPFLLHTFEAHIAKESQVLLGLRAQGP